jgi:hypothetical protein
MAAGDRFEGKWARSVGCAIALACLGACGGGGGDPSNSFVSTPPPNNSNWTPGVFLPSSQFQDQCARPRTGVNSQGRSYPDRQGSVLAENNWLRSWTNELYLWYDEVVDRNPALYSNPLDYFDLLKTTQTTPSGQPKDKFHFTWPTDEWESFSQSGVTAGYGAQLLVVSSRPPREVRVLYDGLRGVGVEVIQIGTTTCGKPYGFYPFDNCGTTYFSVQFKGVNDATAITPTASRPTIPSSTAANPFRAAR